MKSRQGFYFGKVDGSVWQVLNRCRSHFAVFKSATVRCLDSESDPAQILAILRNLEVEACLQNGVVELSYGQLEHALDLGAFTGFDEVWLHENQRSSSVARPDLALTSDSVDFEEGVPPHLETAMRDAGCTMVLGDGCGLNYATTERYIATIIEETLFDK